MSHLDDEVAVSGRSKVSPQQKDGSAAFRRRTLLKATAVGAAGLAVASASATLPSFAAEAEAAASLAPVRHGGVCSPNLAGLGPDIPQIKSYLSAMGATTARISMFFDSPSGARRFSDAQMNDLLTAISPFNGRKELIIQSSEVPNASQAYNQFLSVKDYIYSISATTDVVFEIGNEPNNGPNNHPSYSPPNQDPYVARASYIDAIAAIRDRSDFPSNCRLAVNMPTTGYPPNNIPNGARAYFNAYVGDTGDGRGHLLTGLHAPDVITCFAYGYENLDRADGKQLYAIFDWIREYNHSIEIKVTEAGIYPNTPNNQPLTSAEHTKRGRQYYEFRQKVNQFAGGGVTSVCFYGIPPVGANEPKYVLDGTEAYYIGAGPSWNGFGDPGARSVSQSSATLNGTFSGVGWYGYGSDVTLTAQPNANYTLIGWKDNGWFSGWKSSRRITTDINHTIEPVFAPTVYGYTDWNDGSANALGTRRIMGQGTGSFDPHGPVLRAQVAGVICRAMPSGRYPFASADPGDYTSGPSAHPYPPPSLGMQWDDETTHGNPFPDQGWIDNDLWRNVGTLRYYGVTTGYPDGTFGPTNPVTFFEAITFVTRAMNVKGYWKLRRTGNAYGSPGVHALYASTYDFYVRDGTLMSQAAANWYGSAPRWWFARMVWGALNSYWGGNDF